MNIRVDRNCPSVQAPWLSASLLGPLTDVDTLRTLVTSINPMWALGQVRARVTRVIEESADVRSYVLRPNRAWRGYRAGQHVLVNLEINGVGRQRTFSISSAPTQKRAAFTLTIKRHATGGVTDWIHHNLQVGSILHLSQAHGEFTTDAPAADELLLFSAGSGITPVLSVLRERLLQGHSGVLHFIHVCRGQGDALFDAELHALAAQHANLHLTRWISSERGRFNAHALQQLLPNATDLRTLLCGPTALMSEISELYIAAGAQQRLLYEDFNGAMRQLRRGDSTHHAVNGPANGQGFTAPEGLSLLQAAEAAGLSPAFGCRIGICMTCQCTKLNGTVENLRTGAISSVPGERIQLCISVARSDLELAP